MPRRELSRERALLDLTFVRVECRLSLGSAHTFSKRVRIGTSLSLCLSRERERERAVKASYSLSLSLFRIARLSLSSEERDVCAEPKRAAVLLGDFDVLDLGSSFELAPYENSQANRWSSYDLIPKGGFLNDFWKYEKRLLAMGSVQLDRPRFRIFSLVFESGRRLRCTRLE